MHKVLLVFLSILLLGIISAELICGYSYDSTHERISLEEKIREFPESLEEWFMQDISINSEAENLHGTMKCAANYYHYRFIVKSADISNVAPPPKYS